MKDNKPLVSIKIASYNHAKYIRQTIQSVLDQTYQNFELIIVDDCSPDNSVEIIKSFKDERITLLVNEKNLGAPATSKRAKPLCKGKYFCSLDSDDYFAPDKLEKQVHYMEEHPDADLVVTHVYEVDGEGNSPPEQFHANWFNAEFDFNNPETWIWGNHICHSSVLMKTSVHNEFWDYDSELHCTGDYYNWVRFLVNGAKFHVLTEKLTYYRSHSENITHKYPERTFWEYAFMSAKTLHPYLMRIGRHDLLMQNYKAFLFKASYPSEISLRHLLLNILSTHFAETANFEEVWREYNSGGDQIVFSLHSNIIEELRGELEGFRTELTGKYEVLAEQGRYIEALRMELDGKSEALSEMDRQLSEHIRMIYELRKEVTGRNEELAEQGRYIEEFRKELSVKNEALSEMDRQLSEHIRMIDEIRKEVTGRNEELAEQGRYIEEFRKELAGKNEELAEQGRYIEEFRSELTGKNEALAQQGRQLAEQIQHVVHRDKKIEELLNSYSWRITAPLRSAGNLLLKLRKLFSPKSQESLEFKPYQVRQLHLPHKNRPRIVHAIGNFLTGGSSRLVVDLVEHLGHVYEQEVITLYNPEPLNYIGIPVHVFYPLTTPDPVIVYMERFRPALVHVHYWGYRDKPWYEKIVLAAERFGCRIVENINTPVAPLLSDGIDRYIYVSNYVHGAFGQANEKSLVIHPGSDVSLFTREDLNKVPDDCIGMVYRLEPDKLEEQSIDVFVKVAQRRPNTRILIVGGGPFVSLYREVAGKAGVLNCFTFTGLVSYSELPSLYKKMSIFVAPVWRESFGQVGPFAMSVGIPVVGYDVGALSEIIDNKALLAPLRDSDRLTEIIIDLLDDRKKRLLIGEANQIRVRELFSVEAMINRYRELYKELLVNRE